MNRTIGRGLRTCSSSNNWRAHDGVEPRVRKLECLHIPDSQIGCQPELLPAQHLLLASQTTEAQQGAGFVGYWTLSALISVLGEFGTVTLLIATLLIGATLAFTSGPLRNLVRQLRPSKPPPDREPTHAHA